MRLTRSSKGLPRKTVIAIVAGLVLGLLAWAWIDGGREPLREIAQPIPVPASAQ